MVIKVRKFVIIGILVCYVPTAFVPILYLAFFNLKPEECELSFPVKKIILVIFFFKKSCFCVFFFKYLQ